MTIERQGTYISLNNLKCGTVILDDNKFQASAKTEDVTNVFNYKKIFEAFDFCTLEVNGHNIEALEYAFNFKTNKPKAIIAKTIKGKGFSCMENTIESHYMKIDDKKYNEILKELGEI